MRIVTEKPIDRIYIEELKEIADWYEDDMEFALKQAISLEHTKIRAFKDSLKIKEK